LDELQQLAPSEMRFKLTAVHLNPADPLEFEPYVDLPGEALSKKNVIIVDDVANTGRTIFYGIQPF
jgi:pyrimidine operon attenuation protein/uracil phosphoribosyltransferase